MDVIGEIVKQKLNIHGITQTQMGIILGYKPQNAQPVVSHAVNGKNKKVLDKIISYLCSEHGYEPSDFVPPANKEKIMEIEEKIDRLEVAIKEMQLMLSDLIRKMYTKNT